MYYELVDEQNMVHLTVFRTDGAIYTELCIDPEYRQDADTFARMFCILVDKYLESRQT